MYTGRDMTELSLLPMSDWRDDELQYFHFSWQQMTPYLNSEGKSMQIGLIEELTKRGGL